MGVSTEQSKRFLFNQSNSVHFSHSVVSDSLRPHGCTTPGLPVHHQLPGVYSNSFPLSRWCHPTISSSVVPFSSHLQSFPASGSFQMSQLFASGGQSTGVSASTSDLPMNTQDWSPLDGIDMEIYRKVFGIWKALSTLGLQFWLGSRCLSTTKLVCSYRKHKNLAKPSYHCP